MSVCLNSVVQRNFGDPFVVFRNYSLSLHRGAHVETPLIFFHHLSNFNLVFDRFVSHLRKNFDGGRWFWRRRLWRLLQTYDHVDETSSYRFTVVKSVVDAGCNNFCVAVVLRTVRSHQSVIVDLDVDNFFQRTAKTTAFGFKSHR